MPFEVRAMRAQPDGFELEFTQPVDRATASRPESYIGSSYTYIYQQKYGSPEIDPQPVRVNEALVSEDGKSVQLRCAVGAEDEPGMCETPRERTEGEPGAYTAVAEFASDAGSAGPLLLRSGSNSGVSDGS